MTNFAFINRCCYCHPRLRALMERDTGFSFYINQTHVVPLSVEW